MISRLSMCLIAVIAVANMASAGDPARASGPIKAGDTAKAADDIQDFVYLTNDRPLLIRAHIRVDGKSYREIWNAYVDRVMKFLDTDGDGVLSKKELERMPPIQFLTGGNLFAGETVKGRRPADSITPNKEGKVTREELAAFLRKNGAAPFQFQTGDEGVGVYGARVINLGGPQPVSADALNEAIFALLDTNHDGKLSKEELAAAPSLFATKDVNDDEMITPQELVPNQVTANPYAVKAAYLKGARPVDRSPIVIINAGESGAALASRLLDRYGGKNGGAAKRKLTAKDLGMDQETFSRLDADKDGGLDAEELAQFARRAPDVELTFRIGKKGDKDADVDATAQAGGSVEAKLTKAGGGNMRLDVGRSQIDLRAGDANSSGNFAFNFRLRDQYIDQFKMADKDNNGYLDEKEAMASPIFRDVFKAMDTDGDGMLYEKEMVAYLDKVEELHKAVREGCVTLMLSEKGGGLFDLLDQDHDGRLSVHELRAAPDLIKSLDRNGDGMISLDEIPRHAEMRVRRGPMAGNTGNNFVVIAKGAYSLNVGDSSDKGAGPLWFRKMDVNHDGYLSRREFLGTDEDFKKLDTDGDGLISAKEAEQAEKLWRKATAPKP
jgi:Ca2+-binding EF-hand superfamily protein